MIGIWSLVPIPARPWVILGVVLGLLGAGAHVGYRLGSEKASRDRAEALEAVIGARDQAIRERDLASGVDARSALAIVSLREDLARHAGAIQASIDSQPLTQEVKRVDPKTGAVSTCRERRPDVYRGLFNAAVLGTEPPAATAPAQVP